MHDNTPKIIIDWLSITSKRLSVKELMDMLGLQNCSWEKGHGYHGYRTRYWYDSISIHCDGAGDMGIWLEMSGTGCRAFESYGTGDYDSLFRLVVENPKDYNITRLDVAFDEFSGILDGRRVFNDTINKKFRSKAEYWSATTSSDGLSVNIGSPRSKVLIRIYDKLAERLAKIKDADQRERISEDIPHWMRIELQMRDERALEFIKTMQGVGKCSVDGNDLPIGEVYRGVLANYLEYGYAVPAKGNADKLIWHPFPYWEKVLEGAGAISIYVKPGADYNLDRCRNYVYNMAGNAVDALVQLDGMEGFVEGLKKRHIKQNPKYIMMIEDERERRRRAEEERARWREKGVYIGEEEDNDESE